MDANADKKRIKELEDVSIHAPVMDANLYNRLATFASAVSIHAPVMDAKQTRACYY